MEAPALEARDGGVLLRVKVQPRASRDAVLEACDTWYRVALAAPPVDGAANTALLRFLARTLALRRRQIELISGRQARVKSVRIAEGDVEAVRRALEEAIR